MSQISAQTLSQAREALVSLSQQNCILVGQIKEQGRKIVDLEREVQRQATSAAAAQQALRAAQIEVESLRAQIPGDATISAHDALQQYLSAPAELHPQVRLAA
jgi:hypothetical protein